LDLEDVGATIRPGNGARGALREEKAGRVSLGDAYCDRDSQLRESIREVWAEKAERELRECSLVT